MGYLITAILAFIIGGIVGNIRGSMYIRRNFHLKRKQHDY